jgi:hypothetical protein
MPDNHPFNLEEALQELEALNLIPEKKALLQAKLYLLAGEAKAIETLKSHFLNNSEIKNKPDFDELIKAIGSDEPAENWKEKLHSNLETFSNSYSAECIWTYSTTLRRWICA